jgi:hypothetical protein
MESSYNPTNRAQIERRIHHHFATSTGKYKNFNGSPLAPTTSSEIAEIARIGNSAVQKRYIFGIQSGRMVQGS